MSEVVLCSGEYGSRHRAVQLVGAAEAKFTPARPRNRVDRGFGAPDAAGRVQGIRSQT
jgi:hypothetical protein